MMDLSEYDIIFSEPEDRLPERLPTPLEIEDSTSFINGQNGACCLVRVGASYIAKFGDVNPMEGYNMRFVRQHTSVPVPKVFAIYRCMTAPEFYSFYIIMEDIAGDTLESLWDILTDAAKSNILDQLCTNFTELRNLTDEGYFGGSGYSGVPDPCFWPRQNSDALDGPFNNEEEFVLGLIAKYEDYGGERLQHKANYYRRVLPVVLCGSGKPVFTHNDLKRKSILIREDGTAVITDWGEAGWYPSYWEYAKATFTWEDWTDDWHACIAEILDEYPNQYAWLTMLRRELWNEN
jgi:serine/threonine protein kinase